MTYPLAVAEPTWDSANAADFKSFLDTPTGQKLFQVLAYWRPSYSPDFQRRLVESGIIEGYELAVEKLFDLVKPTTQDDPKKQNGNYPDLDNDEAWRDIEQQMTLAIPS